MVQEHRVQICLAPELRSALIKYCAKHDLDKEYGSLCLVVKSLRSEGFISQEIYEHYLNRYSKTVSSMSTRIEAKPLSAEQMKVKQKLDEMSRTFAAVIFEWDNPAPHKPGWRESWIRQAEKYKDTIPEARQLLEKIANKAGVN